LPCRALALGDRLLGMSRSRLIADLDTGMTRRTTVSDLVGLITASEATVSDRFVIADRTPGERS
jgi:hypothetical protein